MNNVAWDDNDEEDCTLCVPPELHGTEMNSNTLVANNGASKFEGGGGTIENNYESQDVKRQMVDTDNSDYRPVPGGGFISQELNSMHIRFLMKIFTVLKSSQKIFTKKTQKVLLKDTLRPIRL